jgi:2'-5' RNA ligase
MELFNKYEGINLQELTVETITYYESILKPEGPEYIVIGEYALK